MKSGKAFTLIELLIVVAIIAILAAIAVPNFLEAQTRSKVSRVKSDMRTIAVAEEAYFVDWNSYTHSNTEAQNPESIGTSDPVGKWAGFQELTTPVAYITSIPRDGFGQNRYRFDIQGGWRPDYFSLGSGNADTRESAGPPWERRPGFPSSTYAIGSNGPDKYDDTRGDLSIQNYPWKNIDRNALTPVFVGLLYDPTNGTVSGGDIMRFGGIKPAGAVYEFWWSNCLK